MYVLIDTLYKRAVVAVLFATIVLGALSIAMEPKLRSEWQAREFAAVAAGFDAPPLTPSAFDGVQLTAKAAVVYDVTTGTVLYAKNPDMQLPLASLTKLFTAYVARGDLGAGRSITIPEAALLTEGDSGLVAGDTWHVQKLIDYMLSVSSNDSATALALADGGRAVFTSKLNTFARERGLSSVVIRNESGLDESEVLSGAYGSPRDIAQLLAYIALTEPDVLAATTEPSLESDSENGTHYTAVNTNEVTASIPNMIGGKTGYTDLAGGNLAVVFNRSVGEPIAIVVLGSTKEARFTDMLKLVDRAL